MIIVRIWEGLGNQLFQYAYARSLMERTGQSVYLDMRHCNRGQIPYEKEDIVVREIGLQHFRITIPRIDTRKIYELNCLDHKGMLYKLKYFCLKNNIGRWRMADEKNAITDFRQDIAEPKDYTYMNAHYMNSQYYKNYREILLKELQLKRKVNLSNGMKGIFQEKNTVSLHIRLTDYLRNPAALCRQEYYNRAIEYINANVQNPYFIIFTDSPKEAQARYRIDENVYWIYKDGYKDYEELSIMSKCRHNIIAQSTFSYWGAWLNQNPGKIVVAPRQWHRGRLYERDWITI